MFFGESSGDVDADIELLGTAQRDETWHFEITIEKFFYYSKSLFLFEIAIKNIYKVTTMLNKV